MTRPGESGAIRKPSAAAIPVALVYPNAYKLGMGNLGFQFVYQFLNNHPRFSAERVFVPDSPSERKIERPISEESFRPLQDFPVIAFSVPFENDYPAIPAILMAAGIPPLQENRGPGDPVVIAGGVSVSMNPEPLARFLDIAFIGEMEDEPASAGFFSVLAESMTHRSADLGHRRTFLEDFREVPGAYIPSAYDFDFDEHGLIREIRTLPGFPQRVRAVKRLSKEGPVPVSVLFSPEAEFGKSLLVEINRGCSNACRFCSSGWIHLPVRHAAFDRFQDQVQAAAASGTTVGLIGSHLAGHPQLGEILRSIVEQGGRFSLSSIRPEGLTPETIRLMAQTGQKTATLAPEVASSRLKRVIGKEIPSQKFYELVPQLVAAGIPHVRFYFMIGLPTETDNDAQAIVDFVLNCRKIFVEASRPKKTIGRIAVQLNPFVPKPFTPFQWAAMAPLKTLESRLRIVQDGLKRVPNLVVRAESPREALVQAMLSRGDRRLAATLLAAARQKGKWWRVFKKEAVDPALDPTRERTKDEILPWHVVDHGVSKETLWKVFCKATHINGRVLDY
jgi:radical SAM superfamily enzyme YgiQ (UPF0313 family)